MLGKSRGDLVGKARLRDLLAPGASIYFETHYAPLLQMQGEVRAVALEFLRADGSRLPALVNSVLVAEEERIRTLVFDASDRRRYEEELLRARQREQAIAQELQRSLIAGPLPEAPGLEVAASYRPAIEGTEVGGDWFDAFWLDERRIGLVVGDVVGRGIGAAATMGQLRSAVRALALSGPRPARLLESLDAYAARHQVGAMTTLAYAELDLRSRALRFACAGQMPPILALAGEPACLTWDGRSPPLEACARGSERAEAVVELPGGSSVFFFTDGLVERRNEEIDAGLGRLVAAIEPRRREPLSALTAELLYGFGSDRDRDDLCMLAARVTD